MERHTKFQPQRNELFYYDEDDKVYKAIVDRDGLMPVQSVQKRWRDSFIGTELDKNKWEVLQTGAGQTISVSNNELLVTTGTTVNAETILLSKEVFTNPFRVMYAFRISQKIANQEFYMEAVSVDRATGLPDGKGLLSWKVSGTDSVTSDFAVYQTQNQGTLLNSPAVDTNVPHVGATGVYSIFELEPFSDEVWFHSRALDSTNGRTYSAVRHQQMPDPDSLYKLRIRVKNGATAPASNTTMGLQFVNVVDYAELTAEITGGRGQSALGQSMAVQVVNTIPAVSTITTANVTAKALGGTITTTAITTATPFVTPAIDNGSALTYSEFRARFIFDQPVKVEFIHGTGTTVALNKVQETHVIPANTPTVLEFPLLARYCFVRITNTGTATTTVHEAIYMLKGL